MKNAVVTTDSSKQITFMNPLAELYSGICKDEAIGKKISEVIHMINNDTNMIITFDEKEKSKTIQTDTLNLADIVLTAKNGKKTIIDYQFNPITNLQHSTTGYVLVFHDVTEQRDSLRVLQKMSKELERRVKKRTSELQESNKHLEKQIVERKKAEQKENELRMSIENIINSTSEIIIALDSMNRVEYWNKAAERMTGYKKKDVQGRNFCKLPFIENTRKIQDIIGNVNKVKEISVEKIILVTKNYSKKIVNLSCSPLYTEQGKKGVVLVGTDITYDWESHHNLLQGHSYLIAESDNRSAITMFSNLVVSDYKGVYFTRSHPDLVDTMLPIHRIDPIFIRKSKTTAFPTIHRVEDLIGEFRRLEEEKEKRIILIDGIHYFITSASFETLLSTFYEINEIVSRCPLILLLHVNPSMFSEDQAAILRSEFESLPSKKVDDIKIKDELFDIIAFVDQENKKNSLVSYKKIMNRFDIVYYTASKRVNQLVDEGLAFTKKYGKSRVVHLTQKAKTLLEKRKAV